ncbi:RdRP-domain-containing protein [Cubamyces lactineus]|nr:RdRP-domain-containing protein [Cubamyces lactineus]
MEVYMTNIPETPLHIIQLNIANILHAPPFRGLNSPPANFDVYLFPRKPRSTWRSGALTLSTREQGDHFLRLYGGIQPQRSLLIGTTRILFKPSTRSPRVDVVERISRTPFLDPRIAQERAQEAGELGECQVQVSTIQFGWECRDHVYSVEWEKICAATLSFKEDRREFQVIARSLGLGGSRIIAIRTSQIAWVSAAIDQSSGLPTIFFSLSNPPAFETQDILAPLGGPSPNRLPTKRRWSAFDESHEPVAPYVSLALRLECISLEDLDKFHKIARGAHVRPDDFAYDVERRGLFAEHLRQQYADWVVRQPMVVGFQVEALLRSWLLDFKEVLSLRTSIDSLSRRKGKEYTAALLRDFQAHAKARFWYGEEAPRAEDGSELPINTDDPVELFKLVQSRFVYKPMNTALDTAEATSLFYCLHVIVTPTTMLLEGPFPERSNRVMRTYYRSQDSFLRVSFQDEHRLQLRFDRDVDGRDFVDRRVKRILLDGLDIAGAHFDFLAYSQSALREHAVWFVRPFRHQDDRGYTSIIDAAAIIESIGTFKNLAFDPILIRCPARYGARISQAFTATDASIAVEVGQIIQGRDIEDASGKWPFTDGVGTLSPELAEDIWRALQERRRRGRRDKAYPRAYQIRFQGSKGMVSVDHTLAGRSILLRPSMVKFEAPDSLTIEIARAFDKPGIYYLNRPLIMLLEGLGVPCDVFQTLQDNAVSEVQASVESLERSARLLEGHGLGVSFRLTSAMLALHRLGLENLDGDTFWERMMDFATNHILRELKHHARIPVPDSWTLVGVADVHGYLREGEIFACVDSPDRSTLIYLEGRTLISRSPTIHPGDVQVVHAIGRPPRGSPFERESLRNTVVFSIKGRSSARPLPSCLGGGDLDGDVYNVTTVPNLIPPRTYDPASYEPAQKKLVDHDSTIADVADFVAEYIISDTLGIIAITWLIIADQSTEGILDDDCIMLAALHSDAVDYPKSGRPVPIERIPRLKFPTRPDWNAPETSNELDPNKYYESTRAIGQLYRSIELPAVRTADHVARVQRQHLRSSEGDTIGAFLRRFHRRKLDIDDNNIYVVVRNHISGYISTRGPYTDAAVTSTWELLQTYTSRLRAICADHTLSNTRTTMLSEEEAVIGTIVAKCSQPRKRKDLVARMREQTATLTSDIRNELAGEEDLPLVQRLQRAWIAFRVATLKEDQFGARSFGWLALGAIFDAIKEIEEEERTRYVLSFGGFSASSVTLTRASG